MQAEFEEREQKLQAKIDELKANKTKLEHSEKIKKETIVSNYTVLFFQLWIRKKFFIICLSYVVDKNSYCFSPWSIMEKLNVYW